MSAARSRSCGAPRPPRSARRGAGSRPPRGLLVATLAAVGMLALPAAAPAAVGPPYNLSIIAAGVLGAVPAAGSSTLAVQIRHTASGVEFTPAAASAPGGVNECTTTLLTTTCDDTLIAGELRLQGTLLAADVQLHDVSTGILRLTGGSADDTLTVDGPIPSDTNAIAQVVIDPGAGNDAIAISGNVNGVTLAAADSGGDDSYVVHSTSSSITGTLELGDGSDVGSSQAPNLTLDGGTGNDVLSGAGTLLGGTGNDVLKPTVLGTAIDGGSDVDRLSYDLLAPLAPAAPTPLVLSKPAATTVRVAGDGVDKTAVEQVVGGRGGDTLFGTTGADVLSGGEGDDVVVGLGGGDALDGGPGTNTVNYAFGPSPVTVDLAAGTGGTAPLDTLASFRNVVTGPGNDVVTGSSADEAFTLGAGDDVLNAGAGNDSANGGDGNDVLRGGADSDVLDGAAGTDTATYDERGASEPVSVTLATVGGDGAAGESDSLLGIETLVGGASNDTLVGDGGPNTLVGGPGVNTLDGGAGDDEVRGGEDRDVITGGPGNDRLFGAGDDDSINAFDAAVPDADLVSCGASLDDDAQVDATDTVSECEFARRADVPVPVDDDHDGFIGGFDCDDHNPAFNQGATDIPGDGIDQDCDGFDTPVPFVDYGLVLDTDAPNASQPRGIRLARFRVQRLLATSRVVLTCTSGKTSRKAARCPFKSATRQPKAGASEVSLTTLFKNRRLAPGTKVEFRVTAPGHNGRVRRFTIKAVSVTSKELCLVAPLTTPRTCPSGDEL